MTQSWSVTTDFQNTPAPPRVPDTLAEIWFARPPIQFTSQLPPTHVSGAPTLLREDSAFQLNSQLLQEFTATLRQTYPVHQATWGTLIQGNMIPHTPGHYYFDRLQIVPMASETSTADASHSNSGGINISCWLAQMHKSDSPHHRPAPRCRHSCLQQST